MDSNHVFQLEPESPADRKLRQDEFRRISREANRKRRAREALEGRKTVTLTLPQDTIAVLDAVQEKRGLPNRSAALELLLKDRLAADDLAEIKQELGL